MKKDEYYRGKQGEKYGIYNSCAKRFQFGIEEDTPALAVARLFQKIGDDARKWRFEPRRLSGYVCGINGAPCNGCKPNCDTKMRVMR